MDDVTNGRAPITIVIAVAVRLYREGLAATLGAQAHLCVTGTAATSLEAEATVRQHGPDVVIVDASLEDARGLMRTLQVGSVGTRILAFAVREDISAIVELAEAGADGFVTANGSIADVIEAVERTAAGELLCSPRIAAQLLRRAAHRTAAPAGLALEAVLTVREQQVFHLLKQGQSNKEIAAALKIAEATVKNHVHHVLEKLQVGTRSQAIAGALPLKAQLNRPPGRRAS